MIGKTVSHYRILEKLGEGGMGVVYKAEDTKLRRTVALKFLPPELTQSDEWEERFTREAQAAAALDHPNICTTYEIDDFEGKTFISMAYVDGESLEQRISSRPLAVNDAAAIAIQVAEGLQHAHERGIIHRDIKSSNIMLNSAGRVKIMDFGLAKLTGRTRITRTATIMGTVAYMSPEQAEGDSEIDHRTDIWSLGVVLYEMLTGRPPFEAATEAALLHKIIYEEPRAVESLNPSVPPGLSRAVRKTLTKNKDNRYASISDFLRDVRNPETVQMEETDASTRRTDADEQEVRERARSHIRIKLWFYWHLAAYLGVNFALLVINLMTSIKSLWVVWPILGWGIPLFLHGVGVFVFSKDSAIREQMLDREVNRRTRGRY